MRDRENYEYLKMWLHDRQSGRTWAPGALISPARQAKKARGLSGRQGVRWRKAQRRAP
jgi:hypothetical protein